MISEEMRSAFKDSLIRGRYNLLLGAGVCLDSHNGLGARLPSTEQLREDLCTVTGAPAKTSLNRVAGLLKKDDDYLTRRFIGCRPGPSLDSLPQYLWRRLFTFNIDDVLEVLFQNAKYSKQKLVPLNFDAQFEPTPDRTELQSIHMHGWVHQPNSGYVFSRSEYARIMSSLNPWMHLLSEILSTEPFIIAGTSLDEVDLEYYLSFRSEKTPRRDRGPSILVQPNPDVVTKADCQRYGLELFPGTFEEFLNWLHAEVPTPPSVRELVVPDVVSVFKSQPAVPDLIAFFSDFELVKASDIELPDVPTGFLYGREPSWTDIDQHLDIERQDNGLLIDNLIARLAGTEAKRNAIIVLDDAGVGKTTVTRRVAHDLILRGIPVLSCNTTSRLDPEVAIKCLSLVAHKVVVLVDGVADHAEQVMQLLEDPEVESKVVLLATERGYRRDYLKVVFGHSGAEFLRLMALSDVERMQLLERYRKYGLVGTHIAIKQSQHFVDQLADDPIAVAICRIMNDFKPLKEIVKSLWEACNFEDRELYLCVALAEHCIKAGIRYSLLQNIAGLGLSIAHLLEPDIPLGLALNTQDDEYVVATNGVISEQILFRAARSDGAAVKKAFESIAAALAPHVNRTAIMRRSPEARLAGRLFDCDKVVRPLLGELAESFYLAMQSRWEWNSRYWEQRALLVADTDLEGAIKYARHAVAIELHSFPLTTLGKLLFREMEAVPSKRDDSYKEALKHLINAIEREYKYSRVTIHPYTALLSGTTKYLELGGTLIADQSVSVGRYVSEAKIRFGGDPQLDGAIERLEQLL